MTGHNIPWMTNPTWGDILDEPFVALILGRRGSGKTALGHRLLEVFHSDQRTAHILGYPRTKMGLLPEWIGHLTPETSIDDWPEHAIVLVTEAHHLMHSRRSMNAENLELDRLVTLSRQRDLDIILDTQYARRLDVTGVMGATAMIWRYPSLMQEDFERQALRKFVREAKEALDEYVDVTETETFTLLQDTPELHKRAYVFSERFRGIYPELIELPGYWSDDISRAIGSTAETTPESASDTTAETTSDMPDIDFNLSVDPPPYEYWKRNTCPHIQHTKASVAYQNGIFICADCAKMFDATRDTPTSDLWP